MKTCCSDVKVCLGYDYQFIVCEEDIDEQVNEINIFIRSLNRIKTSFLHIERYCLPEDRIQAIIEKSIKIAGKTPCPKNRLDIMEQVFKIFVWKIRLYFKSRKRDV